MGGEKGGEGGPEWRKSEENCLEVANNGLGKRMSVNFWDAGRSTAGTLTGGIRRYT